MEDKYNVYVRFKNGQVLDYYTDNDLPSLKRVRINELDMIMIEGLFCINFDQIKGVLIEKVQ